MSKVSLKERKTSSSSGNPILRKSQRELQHKPPKVMQQPCGSKRNSPDAKYSKASSLILDGPAATMSTAARVQCIFSVAANGPALRKVLQVWIQANYRFKLGTVQTLHDQHRQYSHVIQQALCHNHLPSHRCHSGNRPL